MQNGTKMMKYPAMAIAAILLLSFGMAGSVSAGSGEKVRFVETVQVQGGITIYQEDLMFLADPELGIPIELLQQFSDVEYVNIYVDGLAHVNLMITEKNDAMDVHLHAFWHGTICIMAEGLPAVTLDLKNAHLLLHANLACDSEFDLNVNWHTNGDMTIGDSSEKIKLDLDTHIKINVQNGELKNLKISLPEWLGLVLAEA
jgi:hypothetical protein